MMSTGEHKVKMPSDLKLWSFGGLRLMFPVAVAFKSLVRWTSEERPAP